MNWEARTLSPSDERRVLHTECFAGSTPVKGIGLSPVAERNTR